jgi:hypothetical protein
MVIILGLVILVAAVIAGVTAPPASQAPAPVTAAHP